MINFDPQGLALVDLQRLAHDDAPLVFGPLARQRIVEGHALLLTCIAAGEPIYGVTTSLGALASTCARKLVSRFTVRSS